LPEAGKGRRTKEIEKGCLIGRTVRKLGMRLGGRALACTCEAMGWIPSTAKTKTLPTTKIQLDQRTKFQCSGTVQ
jgi:hypothetical protein